MVENNFLYALDNELNRLTNNAFPDFTEGAWGETFLVKCHGNANHVRQLIKDILLIFNDIYRHSRWPDFDEWLEILPKSFTEKFLPELDEANIEKLRRAWFKMSYEEKLEQAATKQQWRLSNWLVYMMPDERIWFWWGDAILGEQTQDDYFILAVNLSEPYYSFEFLEIFIKNCGADEITFLDTSGKTGVV